VGGRAVSVNHDDLVVERRAELGVRGSVDAQVRPNVVALPDSGPPSPKCGPLQSHPATHDGNQSSTGLEAQQCLLDVPRPEYRAMSPHTTAGRRERRVHYDGVVELVRRKKIVETFGVKRRRLESLKR